MNVMGIARVSRQATKNPTITIKWGEVWCGPKQILMPFEVPCKLYVKAFLIDTNFNSC